MTPPASTAAGRAATLRPPRRVSGPARGRVSGPARGRYRSASAPGDAIALGMRALAVVRSLPEHSLIDGLVRGRAWIPVLGVLLAGIVAMQVEILKLGTSAGRWVERTATLQSRNEALRASAAALDDDQRIEQLAAGMGMVMPTPTSLVFLAARSTGEVGPALANIHNPDPTGFAAQLAAQAATTTAATAATTAATSATSATATLAATGAPQTSASAPATSTTARTTTPSTSSTGQADATPTATPTATPAPATPGPAAPGPATTKTGSAGTTQAQVTGAAGVAPAASSPSAGSTGG